MTLYILSKGYTVPGNKGTHLNQIRIINTILRIGDANYYPFFYKTALKALYKRAKYIELKKKKEEWKIGKK